MIAEPKVFDPRAVGSSAKKARADCAEIIRFWKAKGYDVEAKPVPAMARGRYLIETNLVNGAPPGYVAAAVARQKIIDMNRTRERAY